MARQTTSAYRGVGWDPSRGKWRVQIASKAQGWKHMCRVDSELEAARGYDRLARVLLGEEAVLNFPGEALTPEGRAWAEGVIQRKAGAARAARGRKTKADKARRSAAAKAKHAAFKRRKAAEAAAKAKEDAIEKIGRREVCRRLGISLSTLGRWEREGQLTCGYTLGTRKVYPVAEIDRLVEACGVMREPYEDAARPGVWRVVLGGRDMHRREVLIDAEDLALVKGGSCSMGTGGKYPFVSFSRPGEDSTPLRRAIMGVTGRGEQVCHVNGDPLDCRRANLVVRTYAERNRGRTKSKSLVGKTTTSRFKGVFFESYSRAWRARLGVAGRSLDLGRYKDEEAAAKAYDAGAREHYGEHARVNFPKDGEQGVEVNEDAALPAGMSVCGSRADHLAAMREEDAAIRAAGWMKRQEVLKLFRMPGAAWQKLKDEGKVGQGWRPRCPGAEWYRTAEVERWYETFGPIGEPYPDPRKNDPRYAGCWRVPLTMWASRRENRREVLVDAEALPIVRGRRWGWVEGANGEGGQVVLSQAGASDSLARLVLGLTDKKRFVIFLNHDPLDCRRSNLKAGSRSLVAQRGRKMGSLNGRKYTSRFKGVCLHRNSGLWIAQLKKNRVNRYHGFFKSEVDAAKAYDKAAWELYGPEAFLNFPEDFGVAMPVAEANAGRRAA